MFSPSVLPPLSSGGGHGGEFAIGTGLRVHGGRPDAAVRHREAAGQRHQPHQRGEEEGQGEGREGEGEEEAGGREGERQGKSQEGHAEGTRRHVQVRL